MRQLKFWMIVSAGLSAWAAAAPVARAGEPAKESPSTQPSPALDSSPWLRLMRSALDDLNLSDQQRQKIDGFFIEADKGLKQAREDAGDDRRQLVQKTHEVLLKLREKVSSVLSDEQKETLRDQLLRQAPAEIINGLKSAVEKLDLSAEQKQKVRDIMADAQGEARQLGNTVQAGTQQARDKWRTLVQETRNKLERVLTDAQKQQLHERPQPPQPEQNQNGDREQKE